MGRYGDSGRESTAKKQYEAHEADGFKYDAKANSDFLESWFNHNDKPSVDTSDRVDNKEVSEDTNELIKLAVSNIRQIHPPEVKLCEVCEENAATAVIRPTLSSSLDESRKTVPTTCKNCATKDDTNDYVLDLARCGHARPRYKTNLDCHECVTGRKQNNILTREELCQECNEPINLDNIYSSYVGLICRDCTRKAAIDRQWKNNTYDVECDDCGVTYKKQTNKSKPKTKRAHSKCVNYLQEANATCNVICKETMKLGGITMRCRRKRWTRRRGNKDEIDSKCCGRDKCLSPSQDKECWFVCRKTSENLTICEDVSSENYEGDLKMAAV